ncbi:MAG: YIP1 family protein [Candidatus Saganbacteria bacterium]|nr:YIP1 family protein [Candidatus Saganbacteria bacterium]
MRALKDYFSTWWVIIARPILFYARLKEENWREGSLTFFLITAWLLALIGALTVFFVLWLPTGSTLVAGISGLKFFLIVPVLLTQAFAMFLITFLILGGLLTVVFGAGLIMLAYMLHYVYELLGGRGSLNRLIQCFLYSGAVILFLAPAAGCAVLTRYNLLELSLFRVGFNIVYVFLAVYAYGLWAVAGRKTYGRSKWQAFAGALVPFLLVLIFGLIFDKLGVTKLELWIAPLK